MRDLHAIDLEQLRNGIGCLDIDHCNITCSAAQVALFRAGHPASVECEVLDRGKPLFGILLKWEERTPSGSWNAVQRLGELAAEGIAFLMIEEFTPFTIVSQAEINTNLGAGKGIDYYLGVKEGLDCQDEADHPKYAGRLEISGILRPSRGNSLAARVLYKVEQTKQSDEDGTPAYVIVVEFETPVVNLTQRTPENVGER